MPRKLLFTLVLALVFAVCGVSSALAARGVPVGLYNVNNQVMNSGSYLYALRFVPDQSTTLHRFISGFNLEGTDQLGGRNGYGDGDGGVIRARLVAVRPDGTPDLSQVLAEETVPAWQRYQESKAAYGAPGLTQLLYFNFGGAQLAAGQMYAVVYQNVAANPAANWFSENSPTVKESEAGPNGANNLDPNAGGAVAGLDPREAVSWSSDGGSSWVWGRRVGEGPTAGAYAGSASSDDGTRLPWYGWQTAAGARPVSNQPYYAYKESGSYSLRLTATRAITLTEAGGYAPAGASAGVVTVRNLDTGDSASTPALGDGIVKAALDHAVSVAPGQTYEISNTGTVLNAEADSFVVKTFGVEDRPQLFAGPDMGLAGVAAPGAPAPQGGPVRRSISLAVGGAIRRYAVRPLRLRGRASGPGVRRGTRVAIKAKARGHWRTVAHARVGAHGRFDLRWRPNRRVRASRAVALRAISKPAGRSRPVRVKVRR